jgi:hypothetical protein
MSADGAVGQPFMSSVRSCMSSEDIPAEDAPASSAEPFLRWFWRAALGMLGLLVAILAALVAADTPYTAGSDFGYDLGLAGGLMILSLLAYPLRKRIRLLERLGAMNTWFRYHMFIGIAGPLLIVFHSAFQLRSINGTIAFLAMLLVVLSGVIGRFLYRHVHRGLYGRKLTLAAARDDVQASLARLVSVFSLQGDIEARLHAFHDHAFAPAPGIPAALWRFATLRARAHSQAADIRAGLRSAMVRRGRELNLAKRQIVLEYKLASEQLDAYFDAVVMAAQLSGWERAFSLWHLIHIPFLYLLVISGVVHVIAVHMY